MENYDPSKDIDSNVWLTIGEDDRAYMVQEYVEIEDHLDESNCIM